VAVNVAVLLGADVDEVITDRPLTVAMREMQNDFGPRLACLVSER